MREPILAVRMSVAMRVLGVSQKVLDPEKRFPFPFGWPLMLIEQPGGFLGGFPKSDPSWPHQPILPMKFGQTGIKASRRKLQYKQEPL